jgi:putative NADH-flavin reductase
MKVTVFGATGGTGLLTTKFLLDEGHAVTVYVRNPGKMTLEHEQLTVVQGDIYDTEHISRILKGQEAVISCLGSSTTKKSDELQRMAESITSAMKQNGVSRVVYMATAGIDNEFKGPIKWLIHLMIGNVIKDHKNAADLYRQKDFDYTIAKPMQLKDQEATGSYEVAVDGLPKSKKPISRANVAMFMVKTLTEKMHMNESVALAE